MAIDNLIGARVITAHGKAITDGKHRSLVGYALKSTIKLALVSLKNPAFRGAGHSFSIVFSIKVKAHPQINESKSKHPIQPDSSLQTHMPCQHWEHPLAFAPDQIEIVTEAINARDFQA